MPKPTKVLVDTSVLISALNSSTGASAWLLYLGPQKGLSLFVSNYIIEEAHEVITRKFSKLLPAFKQLKKADTFHYAPKPTKAHLKQAATLIDDPKDIPIVAAALSGKVDFIVTLDQKDFIRSSRIANQTNIKPILPGEALQLLSSSQ